jgi:hypothetical protein
MMQTAHMTALLISRLLDTSATYLGFSGAAENAAMLTHLSAGRINHDVETASMTSLVASITDGFQAAAHD